MKRLVLLLGAVVAVNARVVMPHKSKTSTTSIPSATATPSASNLTEILTPALFEFSKAILPIVTACDNQTVGHSSHDNNLKQHQMAEAFTRSVVTHASRKFIGGCTNHIVYHISMDHGHVWGNTHGLQCLDNAFFLPSFGHEDQMAYMYCNVRNGTVDFWGDMGFINWAVVGEYTRYNDYGMEDPSGKMIKFHELPKDCGSVIPAMPAMQKREEDSHSGPYVPHHKNLIEIVPENGQGWHPKQETLIRMRTEGMWYNATSPTWNATRVHVHKEAKMGPREDYGETYYGRKEDKGGP